MVAVACDVIISGYIGTELQLTSTPFLLTPMNLEFFEFRCVTIYRYAVTDMNIVQFCSQWAIISRETLVRAVARTDRLVDSL